MRDGAPPLLALVAVHTRRGHLSPALRNFRALAAARGWETMLHEPGPEVDPAALSARLIAARPALVGLSVYLWGREALGRLGRALRAGGIGCPVVAGGPEATGDPGGVRDACGADLVVAGEGEGILPALLDAARAGGAFPSGILRPDPPSFDEVPEYDATHLDPRLPFAYYETSRGCPGRCVFCHSASAGAVRAKPLERVRRELAAIAASGFTGEIRYLDRTANHPPERFLALLDLAAEAGPRGAVHQFEVDPRHLDPAAVRGCAASAGRARFRFEVGLQTVVDGENRALGRAQDGAAALRALRALGAAGIECHVDLLAGIPGQTLGSAVRSLDAALALEPASVQLWPLKLLPGTALARGAAASGIVADARPPYEVRATPTLAAGEMERLARAGRALNAVWNGGTFRRAFRALAARLGHAAALLEIAGRTAFPPGGPGPGPASVSRAIVDSAPGDPRVVAAASHAWRLALGKRASRPPDPRMPRGERVPGRTAQAERVRYAAHPDDGRTGGWIGTYDWAARMAGRADWWSLAAE